MAITPLTINRLDEDGLKIIATVNILENVEGLGTAPDGNSFVNTKKTYLVLYATGHTATVVLTVVPPVATLQTGQYGELDVDDIVITLAISYVGEAAVPQMTVVQIPVAYNTAGKALIKATSSGAFEAGEVKIGAIELA